MLTPEFGGGILWRQGAHHFDLIRTIAGGMVRSVRGSADVWDPNRHVPGCYSAYLDFEDGTVASAVCSGYDHFDSMEFVRPGFSVDPANHANARRELRGTLIGRRAPRAGNSTAVPARVATSLRYCGHLWDGLWAGR